MNQSTPSIRFEHRGCLITKIDFSSFRNRRKRNPLWPHVWNEPFFVHIVPPQSHRPPLESVLSLSPLSSVHIRPQRWRNSPQFSCPIFSQISRFFFHLGKCNFNEDFLFVFSHVYLYIVRLYRRPNIDVNFFLLLLLYVNDPWREFFFNITCFFLQLINQWKIQKKNVFWWISRSILPGLSSDWYQTINSR